MLRRLTILLGLVAALALSAAPAGALTVARPGHCEASVSGPSGNGSPPSLIDYPTSVICNDTAKGHNTDSITLCWDFTGTSQGFTPGDWVVTTTTWPGDCLPSVPCPHTGPCIQSGVGYKGCAFALTQGIASQFNWTEHWKNGATHTYQVQDGTPIFDCQW